MIILKFNVNHVISILDCLNLSLFLTPSMSVSAKESVNHITFLSLTYLLLSLWLRLWLRLGLGLRLLLLGMWPRCLGWRGSLSKGPSRCRLAQDVHAARGTSLLSLEPWTQAGGMEDMAAWKLLGSWGGEGHILNPILLPIPSFQFLLLLSPMPFYWVCKLFFSCFSYELFL